MGRPYVIYIGYDECADSLVNLPAETFVSDEDGAGLYEPDSLAHLLNSLPEECTIVLPWMGHYRLVRNRRGKWHTEYRECVCADCERKKYTSPAASS
jgi:hypothetical protein